MPSDDPVRTTAPPDRQVSARRILHNGAANTLAQGVYAALNVVVVIALARGAGKEVVGGYYTLFAVLTVAQLVLEAGLSVLLTCRVAQAGDGWRKLAAEAMGLFGLLALASFGLFLVAGVAWAVVTGDVGGLLACAAAGLACAAIQVQRFCIGVFRAFDAFRVENLARVIQPAAFAAFTVGLVGFGWASVGSVMAALAVSQVGAAVWMLTALHRRWGCLCWRPWPIPLREWLRQSVPLGAGDVLRGLTFELDTLVLGLVRPPAVVGMYTVAYRPIGPLGWASRGLLTAAFPSLARLAAGDPAALRLAASRSTRLLWAAGLPMAVAVSLSAEPIVLLTFGPAYAEAVPLMRVLIWLVPPLFLSTQLRYFFTAVGRQGLFVRLVVLGLLFKAAALAVLIPAWGYLGACAGSLAAEAVFAGAGLALCNRLGIVRAEWSTMARAVLAAGVMAGLLYPALGTPPPVLAASASASAGAYLVLCILLGVVRRDEVGHVWEAVRSLVRPPAGKPETVPVSPAPPADDGTGDGDRAAETWVDVIRAAEQRMDGLRTGVITPPPALSRSAVEQALGGPVRSHELWQVTWNRIYRVRTVDDRAVVAKQGCTQTGPELLREYGHLDALARLDVPGLVVPRPLALLPAERAYLADLVPGHTVVSLLKECDGSELERACGLAGRVLGRIHAAWADGDRPVPVHALGRDLARTPGEFSRPDWETIERALDRLTARRVLVGQPYLDFNPRNALVHGGTVALIDPPKERRRGLLLWDYATFEVEIRREWWKASIGRPWRGRWPQVSAGLGAFARGYSEAASDAAPGPDLGPFVRLLQLQRLGQMMTERLAEVRMLARADSPIPRGGCRACALGAAAASLGLLEALKHWLLRRLAGELKGGGRASPTAPVRRRGRVTAPPRGGMPSAATAGG